MNNAVVWVDLPVLDVDRAVNFYNRVLACQCHTVGQGDDRFAVVPHGPAGVGICLTQEAGEPSAVGAVLYLNCEGRLEDAIAQVEPAGGKVLKPREAIAPHGSRALILDSEGNRMALHSM